jgi:enterochelin esterase-like enzyme
MRRVLIGLLLLCLLAACSADQGEPTLAPTETHTPTFTASPTETLWPTPSKTTVPTKTPLTCWENGGIIVDDQVPSDVLGEEIPLLIYLPPCFFQQPEEQFPVLYLIHGQNFGNNQWYRLGITEIADSFIGSNETAPFLIVMPYVAKWDQPSDFPLGQALVEEVIPYIEAGYRTSPLRADRAVGGLSRGGSWALHLGIRYWEIFGILGGHSAPVFLDDASDMPAWLDAIPPDDAPRIYLDIVTSELSNIRRSATWFSEQLEARGISHQFHEHPGYHSETYWQQHVEKYLRFYTAEWRP